MDTSADSAYALVFALIEAGTRATSRLEQGLSNIKGISFSEYQLLRALERQHRSTATRVELAALVGLTPSGVTRALKPLEKLGFVETKKDARDARRALATLTVAGHELVGDAAGVVNDAIEGFDALTAMNAHDRARLVELLEDLSR